MNSLTSFSHRVLCVVAASAVLFSTQRVASAANGTWITTTDGQWEGTGNWSGGTIADGADNTANFGTLDIVNLGAPFYRAGIGITSSRTIGHMIFGDTDTGTPGAWELYVSSGTPLITLAGTTPSITVNPMGPIDTGTPPIIDDAIIRAGLAGTSGLTKLGNGVLTIGGPGNTLTGGVNVNAGTLRVRGNAGTPVPTVLPLQSYTMASGTTLETVAMGGGNFNPLTNSVTIAAGGTATVRLTTAGTMVPIRGNGSTLNFVMDTTGLGEMRGDWALGGALTALNVSTNPTLGAPGTFRLDQNRDPNNFNENAFATTKVHLDNVIMPTRTRSFGNTVLIGELTGTSTGILAGGAAGSAARYEIGGLNTDHTFAGEIRGAGGLSLNKVGTGKLTLSGTFNGTAALTGNTLARQGGVFRVTTGTLAITNATSIPGGTGTTLTTIDVLPGATLDTSAVPGGTFSTSALQKVQGAGTVKGNWNHAAGQINAGDVGAATVANEGNLSSGVTPTAGTILFDGNMTMGGGNIVYDMSLTPGSGNDLVHVTGTTALNSGKVVPSFLAGIPTSGQYTVLTSDSGFTGAASNLTVDWPGRGANPTLSTSGSNLVFTAIPVGDAANLVWKGTPGNTWDIETSQNWDNAGGSDGFYNLVDSVTFNETAGNKTVVVSTAMQPTSVTINNTTPYIFNTTTAGAIVGPTGLTKTGGGTLTMNLANTFTGTASVDGGTVDIGTFGSALGTGPLVLNGVTIQGINGGGLGNTGITNSGTTVINVSGTVGTNNAFNVPTLSGNGTVTITSTAGTPVADKWFPLNGTAAFTGTINLNGGIDGGTPNHYRFTTATGGTTFPAAVVNLNDARISNRQGGAAGVIATFAFGELHGDANSRMNAFEGGGSAINANWQIGALNTNSDFAGSIQDGPAVGVVSHVTKVGTGTLLLTGANTYSGDTRVQGGTLSVTQTNTATAGDVYMTTGGIFNLGFVGTDVIDSLFFDNVPKAIGTWGRLGHPTASFTSSFFTGDGLLQVSTLGVAPVLAGDFNLDDIVDAADYTVWRNNLGDLTEADINNRGDGLAGVDEGDYTVWVANYGRTTPGPGGGGIASQVPEPASWLLMLVAMAACGWCRKRQQFRRAI